MSSAAPVLDIERFDDLLGYLRAAGHVQLDERPLFTNLAGGVSNRTVLVQRPDGRAFVLKQALEQLRVATDWHSDPRRIEREALGLEWLAKWLPPGAITPLLFLDRPRHLLAMEAVPQPHVNWKTRLLAGQIDGEEVRQFGELLASIHRESQHRDQEMAVVFEERTFFRTLRLEPYYQYAAEAVPEARDFLHELVRETECHRETVVHGDYSPKNVLVRAGKLVLLDHEVIHYGDPAFDLGFALTHFLSKAHHLPVFRPAFVEAAGQFWLTYLQVVGSLAKRPEFEERIVRQTLGCMLARVAGRSPLEYLTRAEKLRQRGIVVTLLPQDHRSVDGLLEAFLAEL